MKWHEKVRIVLYAWWFDVKRIPGKVKRWVTGKKVVIRE